LHSTVISHADSKLAIVFNHHGDLSGNADVTIFYDDKKVFEKEEAIPAEALKQLGIGLIHYLDDITLIQAIRGNL
jgi:hypothetical protein